MICRGLVEAHGGRIRARSAGPGRGARIVFTLPAAEEPAAAAAAPPARHSGEKTPVLVVDDDPHALRRARDALAGAGYAPAAVGLGMEALEIRMAGKRPPCGKNRGY